MKFFFFLLSQVLTNINISQTSIFSTTIISFGFIFKESTLQIAIILETYVGHVLVASVIVNLTTCLKISLNDGDDLCEELLMVSTYSFGKKGITFAKSFKKK